MWNDIDLYDSYRDFTTDPVVFPAAEHKAFIDSLHAAHQHCTSRNHGLSSLLITFDLQTSRLSTLPLPTPSTMALTTTPRTPRATPSTHSSRTRTAPNTSGRSGLATPSSPTGLRQTRKRGGRMRSATGARLG
jgi:hypothetical protein